MTTLYLVMCSNETPTQNYPKCEYVAQTLDEAQTQMANCATSYIASGQQAYQNVTFTSLTSSDGLTLAVIMEETVSRYATINGVTYSEIPIVNTIETIYAKMFITTVTQ